MYIFLGDQEVCREADGHHRRQDRHQAQQGHLVPGRQGRSFQVCFNLLCSSLGCIISTMQLISFSPVACLAKATFN